MNVNGLNVEFQLSSQLSLSFNEFSSILALLFSVMITLGKLSSEVQTLSPETKRTFEAF